MSEYIYYIVTSPQTIKLGGSSSINRRQKAHFTSSPFLITHSYKVNDARKAEKELHRLASKYRLKLGDKFNNMVITNETQLDEHYKMTEECAKKLCESIQKKFYEGKQLDPDRTYCVGCRHVVNISTVAKNDGLRCKRCFEKISKQNFMMETIIKDRSKLPYVKDELNEMYHYSKHGDSYDYIDDFIDDDDDIIDDNDINDVEMTDNIYEVEKILDHKFENGKVQYYLKWIEFEEPSWEPEENLNCPELLEEYKNNLIRKTASGC